MTLLYLLLFCRHDSKPHRTQGAGCKEATEQVAEDFNSHTGLQGNQCAGQLLFNISDLLTKTGTGRERQGCISYYVVQKSFDDKGTLMMTRNWLKYRLRLRKIVGLRTHKAFLNNVMVAGKLFKTCTQCCCCCFIPYFYPPHL